MVHLSPGPNTIISVGGTVAVTMDADTVSSVDLDGVLTTFDISSNTGSTLTINSNVVGNNLNIDTNGGAVTLESGILSIGAIGDVSTTINGGSFAIGANLITGSILTHASIGFGTDGGVSIVGTPGSPITLDLLNSFSPYTGFLNTTDIIDDVSLSWTGSTSYTISDTGTPGVQQIAVTQGGQTFTFETSGANLMDVTDDTMLSGGPLHIYEDADGGTNITVCFLAGTHVLTPTGEAQIETLRIGDMVTTADGGAAPIRWVGVETVSTVFADPMRSLPVRIRAGSLGENLPTRDLLVSPCHAVFYQDVLIQAGALVNGVSIIRELKSDMTETFKYYHIELEDHALIVTEGLPSETFIDNVDRRNFDNWAEHQALYGDGTSINEMNVPRVQSARQLPASVKAAIVARQARFAEMEFESLRMSAAG